VNRRRYRRRRRDSLSSAADDAAHIAAKLGPVGALWTGVIGFAVFYAVLPVCMMTLTADRKATLKGPFATTFGNLLDQVLWQRFISPCQWAGVTILLVCSAITIRKLFDPAELDDEDVTLMSAISKVVSRLIGH
jgi:hypothetical protein